MIESITMNPSLTNLLGTEVLLNVNITDNGTIVDASAMVNGGIYYLLFNPASGLYEGVFNAPMSDGSYIVEILGTDDSGNIGTGVSLLTVDTAPPNVSFIFPSENERITGTSFNATILIDEFPKSINYSIDDSDFVALSEENLVVAGNEHGGGVLAAVIDLANLTQGIHSLDIMVSDILNNTGTFSVNFIIAGPKGDADGDGDIDVFDMIRIGQHIVQLAPFSETQFFGADVSPAKAGQNPACGNGIVDVFDMIDTGQAVVSQSPSAFITARC
jgi:hypothetical protein